MSDFFVINLDSTKECFTVKSGKVYHGAVNNGNQIYLTQCTFDSALQAANAARKLKKENKHILYQPKNEKQLSKSKNVKVEVSSTKIKKNFKIYSESESKTMTERGIQMMEIWLIQDKKSGMYVSSTLEDKVAEYEKDKQKAQCFRNFENAVSMMKLLNSMLSPGHQLRRMYVPRKSVKCKEDKF